MAEGENPTRRYKWFRPRQAARGYLATGQQSNLATISLFNNSTGAFYLVVRDIQIANNDYQGPTVAQYVQGPVGSPAGTITPLIPDMPSPPGVLNLDDTLTVYPGDYAFGTSSNTFFSPVWSHDFPLAVLPPNWSFVLQVPSSNDLLAIALMWEAILADELDFAYDY